jgi:hypothetical protein
MLISLVLQRLKDNEAKIAEHDSTIQLLKSLGAGSSGDGNGIIDQLEILIENLRKECYGKFADRSDLDSLKSKLDGMMRHL